MPALTDAKAWDHSSGEEQLAWVSKETEKAIEIMGQVEGWYKYSDENLWSENHEAILANLHPENCRPNKSGPQPGRYSLQLDNGKIQQPFEAAKQLRAYWAEQGWTITDIVPLGSTETPIEYFRADRADGAMLSFDAGELAATLYVQSSCSDSNMTR